MIRRALILLSVPFASVLLSAPAQALNREDGDEPGTGLTVLQTLGIFVGAPVALYLIIAVIVMAFNSKKGGGVADLDTLAPFKDEPRN